MDDAENLNAARIGVLEDQVSFKSRTDAKRASCQKLGVRNLAKPSHLLLYREMTEGLVNLREKLKGGIEAGFFGEIGGNFINIAVRPRANNVSKTHTVPVFLLCRSMSCARFFSQ